MSKGWTGTKSNRLTRRSHRKKTIVTKRLFWRVWSMREAGYRVQKIATILELPVEQIEAIGVFQCRLEK